MRREEGTEGVVEPCRVEAPVEIAPAADTLRGLAA